MGHWAGAGGEEGGHGRAMGTDTGADPRVDSYALLLASVPERTRCSFRDRMLGPLEEYDSERRAELLHTLEVFLSCSGSWSRTATRLHVHVNTLRYRIRRIEDLTGRDLGTLEDRVDFFLALRATRPARTS
ncbi:PucR family transcriptional regulator [Actinomadura yumaensis]|uniref:PucR family transcriptional regulator n=2 Tax=Thermomonosporaceae TaxID=2012 RepID=A0ABW2CJZ5_9ACTN